MENRMLTELSKKVGIYDDKIIRQAGEYSRRLEIRSGSGVLAGLNLSSSSCAVLCLHLAATAHAQPVDMPTAVKISGLQKKAYLSSLRALENLLQLSTKMTIPDLAVQWGCPSARPLAIQILQKYRETHSDGGEVEFSDALFNSAALFTACKKTKAKVDKTKVVQSTGVKRATFDRLVSQMENYAEQIISSQKESKTSCGHGKSFAEQIQDVDVTETEESVTPQSHCNDDTEEEPYSEWKSRILTQAYHALGKVYKPETH